MSAYESRILSKIVCPVGDRIFSEGVTNIEIQDDAGGEYLKIWQNVDDEDIGCIKIMQEEWPMIKKTIDEMFAVTRDYDDD